MLAVHPFYVLPPAARGVLTAMQIVLYQGIPTPSKQIRMAQTFELISRYFVMKLDIRRDSLFNLNHLGF